MAIVATPDKLDSGVGASEAEDVGCAAVAFVVAPGKVVPVEEATEVVDVVRAPGAVVEAPCKVDPVTLTTVLVVVMGPAFQEVEAHLILIIGRFNKSTCTPSGKCEIISIKHHL